MTRKHIEIQVGGESPIRIITSPDDEKKGVFNVLVPKEKFVPVNFEWPLTEIDEFDGVTEAELLEMFTIALHELPFYPTDKTGRRRMTTAQEVARKPSLEE